MVLISFPSHIMRLHQHPLVTLHGRPWHRRAGVSAIIRRARWGQDYGPLAFGIVITKT